MLRLSIGIFFLLLNGSLFAEVPLHQRIERIAVFPFETPKDYRSDALDAWWAVREELTKSKRFLLAAEAFLQKKNVFQSRAQLEPADVILLARLLDAQVLVTCFLEEKDLYLHTYSASTGQVLWKKSIQLSSSLPLQQQIKKSALKLVRDFVADIPYHGHVVRDDWTALFLREKEGKKIFTAEVGEGSGVELGDTVELAQIRAQSLEPLFQGGARVEILGQGKVVSIKAPIIEVELSKSSRALALNEDTLVRFPKETRRLRDYSIEGLMAESHTLNEVRKNEKNDEHAIWTALGYVMSLAGFLIFAL